MDAKHPERTIFRTGASVPVTLTTITLE